MNYFDEARQNAVLLLQFNLVQLQSNCIQGISNNLDLKIYEELKIPTILNKRNLSDDIVNQSRLVDNEEITILGLIDSHGIISLDCRLEEFMVFLTRISKVTLDRY
jgi:hypothetical protein